MLKKTRVPSLGVILTAPHVCLDTRGRLIDPGCDLNTDKYVMRLSDSIENSTVILSRTPRKRLDNNRIEARNSNMRRRLRTVMKTYHSFILFDIHSFTHGGDFNLDVNPDIVLLYLNSGRRLTRMLLKNMARYNVSAVAIPGSTVNDIMMEALEYGAISALIEIRDSIDANGEKFTNISNAIKATINQLKRL